MHLLPPVMTCLQLTAAKPPSTTLVQGLPAAVTLSKPLRAPVALPSTPFHEEAVSTWQARLQWLGGELRSLPGPESKFLRSMLMAPLMGHPP